MECGKLTAKLRDAVLVCLLVEGKEIKRYKNIEIPDELKRLEYQDFEFNVPANGNITFKISFAPGVLPKTFPQARERKTRAPQETPATVVGEAPAATPGKATAEAAQEKTAIITLKGDLIEDVPEAKAAGEETTSLVEAQAGKDATPEAVTETGAKDTKLAKKAVAKPKKVPVKSCKK